MRQWIKRKLKNRKNKKTTIYMELLKLLILSFVISFAFLIVVDRVTGNLVDEYYDSIDYEERETNRYARQFQNYIEKNDLKSTDKKKLDKWVLKKRVLLIAIYKKNRIVYNCSGVSASALEDQAEHAENLTYEVFSTTPHMPKLNTANEETAEYLLEIAQYWIKEFDIDAWRLDVANEIDHHFWKRFYAATHELKSDFYILGEVWHSAQEWVEQEEFDAVMNYPFTESIALDFVNHETTAKEMVSMLSEHLMKYRDQTNEVMLNAMDTHDTARLLTLCHGNKELQRQTLAFMFTQPGAPCVYYGTEVGLDGGFDPGCRKCMIWDEEKQDHEMFAFMQKLIKLRKDYADIWSKGKVEYRNVCDETNSLEVVRSFDGAELHCFFNMGEKALEAPCSGEVLLGQNLKDDKIEKDGFIIVKK